MIKNAYIHIPFCRGKCFYCSFVSFNKLDLKQDYLSSLNMQIGNEYKGEKLETVYVGGGTPSILSVDEHSSYLSLLNFSKDSEVTIEVNPNDVCLEYLNSLRSIGFNRLSLGIQTFDDVILKSINRRHTSSEAVLAIASALNSGFDNINLDFIYGLPNQTIESFLDDLKNALDFGIQHLSLYGLKIEKDCTFYDTKPENLPDADLQADMYLAACDFLKAQGFIHYEVSNFAKPGFESQHNLNYWNNNSYYGFGCAASGYGENTRYTNSDTLEKYIVNPLSKSAKHLLSEQEILEESIFLGFRKFSGIDKDAINNRFNIDFDKKYARILEKYSEYFEKTASGWTLNLRGVMISNNILCEFIGY